MQHKIVLLCAALALSTSASTSAFSDELPKPLLNKTTDAEKLLPSSQQVVVTTSTEPPGLVVTIQPGTESYPGIALKPEGGIWDLSKYGHIEARVVNIGEKDSSIALRVDNATGADNPWNTESVSLKPGEAGTITTIFGYAYGKKPNYALKPEAVSNLLIFALKSDAVQKFRIESLQAAGPAGEKPPIDPDSIRIKPENGFLFGNGALLDAKQLSTKNTRADLKNDNLQIVFPANQNEQKVEIKPLQGRWDLRHMLQMRVQLKNEGAALLTAKVRLESNGGPSDWVTQTIDAGAQQEVIVPFASAVSHNLVAKPAPNKINNDAVSALVIEADKSDTERTLSVQSVKADLPALQIPDWLGQKPPVEGEWVQTLNDNFDGPLDTSIWEVRGENYWDKQSHFSQDNVIIENGVAKIRYEKKTGFHNDDPKRHQTDWQSGYLHTFDKWAQRYGYFEARMKLPKSPGLWPAFWMMPDRGRASQNRQDTGNGGMEFDIMEHLTRWGGNRYNIAMHYDGYGKEHKAIGTDKLYVQPDKDGYITSGLLWLPGLAVYYGNGVELARWEDPRISSVPEILMFTLPMGGWDNDALDEKKLPDDFMIDYVRVWQRRDLASPEDGKKPPLKP